MRKFGLLVILGLLLIAGQMPVRAASAGSDWPSLGYDAGQTNDNVSESTVTARNVLQLGKSTRWAVPIADASYPIVAAGKVFVPFVAGNKIHVQVREAATGKLLGTYTKDGQGGLLWTAGKLYLAGHIVQELDPDTGSKIAQINARPSTPGGSFLDPVSDSRLLVTGYASTRPTVPSSVYAIALPSNQVVWKGPSLSAQATIGAGRILTQSSNGSDFYDEASGKVLAQRARLSSDWFAGKTLVYTVACLGKGKATVYAVDSEGHSVWKRVVGPYMITAGWPHALQSSAVYVQTLTSSSGIEALDPESGTVLWNHRLADIQRIVLANGMVFALTYALGQPVRVVVMQAKTGKTIGAIVLGPGFYAFNAANELMVANGMLFLRAVGPHGSELVALGL